VPGLVGIGGNIQGAGYAGEDEDGFNFRFHPGHDVCVHAVADDDRFFPPGVEPAQGVAHHEGVRFADKVCLGSGGQFYGR